MVNESNDAEVDQPVAPEEPPRSFGQWARDTLRTWLPAILVVIVIRVFVFEPFRIPSASMVPTLLIGDHVFVTKFSYGVWVRVPYTDIAVELVDLGDPQRGDIIVFRFPLDPSVNYIKRVVGTPGDRVRVANNQVFINDEPQARELVPDAYSYVNDRCSQQLAKRWKENLGGLVHDVLTNRETGGDGRAQREIVIPPGKVFVMGDNRDNSLDSRSWGFVDYKAIKGKARFVWLSWDTCAPGFGGTPRGDRMFRGLY